MQVDATLNPVELLRMREAQRALLEISGAGFPRQVRAGDLFALTALP